jgi:hypothetical protein
VNGDSGHMKMWALSLKDVWNLSNLVAVAVKSQFLSGFEAFHRSDRSDDKR